MIEGSPRHRRSSSRALASIRICDLTGQLAGAGATKMLAAFGAQVIRIEDPTNQGRWDILRGSAPYIDERRGTDLGGAFNNHNAEKLGITLNLRTDEGKALFARLVAISDAVTENFAAGVMARLGFHYEQLRAIKPDIVYVSNCGFGHVGPYSSFKTWGPIVQACSGLTFLSGLPGQEPAGWGYSYMDHMGANIMAVAILAALVYRNQTGQGQWVDMSCVEAGASLLGPETLDVTVNGQVSRRPDRPSSNRNRYPLMVPHGVYRCAGDDEWMAVACRDDDDWQRLAPLIALAPTMRLDERAARAEEIDAAIEAWCGVLDRRKVVAQLKEAGLAAEIVARPGERIDDDPRTQSFGLWPTVHHSAIGDVRVDGEPVHLSRTDWSITQGAACLGEDNDYVFGELLGVSADEIERYRAEGVI